MPKKSKKDSLYYQIQEDIKDDIQNLKLKEGEKIMSETQICEFYNVSRITAKRALNELVKEGYIKRIPGKGSFVNFHILEMHMKKCYSFTEEMITHGHEVSSKTIKGEIQSIENTEYYDVISKKTFWHGDEKVYHIMRIRYVDQYPTAISETFIPLYIFSEEEREKMKNYSYNKINHMIYTKVRERQGMVKRAIEDIKAVCLEEDMAQLLQLNKSEPVIRTDRIAYMDEDVLEYTIYYQKNIVNRYQMEFANTEVPLRAQK